MTAIRTVRAVLAFVVGLLLGGYAVLSHAALEIAICGSSTYQCMPKTNITADGPSGFGAIPVGAEAGSVELSGGGSGGGSETVRIPLSPAARKTPDGWQDPDTPPATAPMSSGVTTYYYNAEYGSIDAACAAMIAYENTVNSNYVYTLVAANDLAPQGGSLPDRVVGRCDWSRLRIDWQQTTTGKYDIWSGPSSNTGSCPAGYVGTTTCTLSDPQAVQKPEDGECGLVKADGVITMDFRDPDCSGTPGKAAAKYGLTCSGGVCESRDGSRAIEVSPANSGGDMLKITQGNGDGTTTISQLSVSAPGTGSSGTVIGKSQSTVQGEGSLITDTPATGGGGSGSGGGDGTMDCPECAKETTLQKGIGPNGVILDEKGSEWQSERDGAGQARDGLNSALDDLQSRYGAAASSGVDALGIPGLSQFSAPSQADQSGLESMLPDGGSCVPLTVTMMGASGDLSYCGVADYMRPLINWMTAAFAMIYIWSRLYRKGGA